jgi:hypothetical protein
MRESKSGAKSRTRQNEFNLAEYYLYSRLRRKYGSAYEDPFAQGPLAMVELINAFLAFLHAKYPNLEQGAARDFASLIRVEIERRRAQNEVESRLDKDLTERNNHLGPINFAIASEIIRGMPVECRKRLLNDYAPKSQQD